MYRSVIHDCKHTWLIFVSFPFLPVLLAVIFPYPFLLSVLVVTLSLSPGSGKNGRTKHRREQGSLGVWAGGFVGQPAGHTKRVRTRERKQKGDAEPERCKRDPGYGCGCCRGSRERGRDEEGNSVNTRSCFVIHSCRTFALTPLAFYSPALSSACPPFTPRTPISIPENF